MKNHFESATTTLPLEISETYNARKDNISTFGVIPDNIDFTTPLKVIPITTPDLYSLEIKL